MMQRSSDASSSSTALETKLNRNIGMQKTISCIPEGRATGRRCARINGAPRVGDKRDVGFSARSARLAKW